MNESTRNGGLDLATIHAAPKVLLHDHLDGGLRPQTVIELARDGGYTGLPTTRRPDGPWVKFAGTPYAYIVVPSGP